jgi:hypothetical protein
MILGEIFGDLATSSIDSSGYGGGMVKQLKKLRIRI